MLNRILFPLFLFFSLKAFSLDVRISAKAAILMNAETGAILYQKNAHIPRYPASITKIATCLYALETGEEALDQKVTCPPSCLIKTSKKIKKAHQKQALEPEIQKPEWVYMHLQLHPSTHE